MKNDPEYQRQYREKNREALRIRAAQYYREHKEETQARAKKWAIDNADRYRSYLRNWNLQKKYGISLEEYEALLESQDGVCAICRKEDTSRYHVDHDHETGEVRGLLCGDCNKGLGMFKDNPDALQSAIDYLKRLRHE